MVQHPTYIVGFEQSLDEFVKAFFEAPLADQIDFFDNGIVDFKQQGDHNFNEDRPKLASTLYSTKDTILESTDLLKKLNEYSNIVQVEKDEYWPEVITVIDRGYHIIKDNGWFKAPTKGYYTLHNNDPSECLLGLYTYLTLIIEAWNSCSHPTQFQDYYKPFD